MAWRIADSVIKGEIDNRIKGKVTGQVWLVGVPEPVRLELEGNAWRDVAGSLLTFRNPHAQPADSEPIAPLQQGVCGDMTASRKVKIPTFPISELEDYDPNEAIPSRWSNVLYLEWFSHENGRVVIEGVDFEVTLSEPVWRLTVTDEEAQRLRSADAMDRFMERLSQEIEKYEVRFPNSEDDENDR